MKPRRRDGFWTMLVAVALATATAGQARPPEWLQPQWQTTMAADDHHAVMLLRSAHVRYIASDRVRRTYRGAVRVLDEHGRSRAFSLHVLNPDTEKIISAQAWVIAPDGRKSQAYGTSSFTDTPLPVGRHFWLQHRLISFSGADKVVPGGVLAWEFQLESRTGIAEVNWSFDCDIPVQKSVLEIAPPPGGKIEWYSPAERVAAPAPGPTPGELRWELGSISPAKGEPPQGFLPEGRAVFARLAAAPGTSGIATWGEFARLAADVIEPRLIATAELKARAHTIVANHTTRWEKIRALCEWVQRDITYLSVTLDKDYLAGYRPRPADEVLQNRYGDCKDKMALLIAMLRAIGEDGFPVLVVAGDPRRVRPEWPSAVFNHVIVGIPADERTPASWPIVDASGLGQLVLFDPTDRITPLGFLPVADQSGRGLVASPRANELLALPVPKPTVNRYQSNIEAVLDREDGVTVRMEENVHGAPAVMLRAAREPLNSDQSRRAVEARLREGSTAVRDLKFSENWDSANAHANLRFEFKAERYARRTGPLVMVSPQIVFSRSRLAAWIGEQPGVAWIAGASVEKDVRLILPGGTVIEELPDDVVLESGGMTGRLTYRRDGDAVLYRYEQKQPGGLLERAAYEAWRGLLQKLQEAERRPIVLRHSPTTAATAQSNSAER